MPRSGPGLTDRQGRIRLAGMGAAAGGAMSPRMQDPTPLDRLLDLVVGLRRLPPGRGRIALAFAYGAACHALFAAAVLAMIVAMFFCMSESLGRVPAPWSRPVNALLGLQFPLVHSVLLTRRGQRALARLAPGGHGGTLATTTYALIASAQLLVLFAFWTPTGHVWWRAEGAVFWVMCSAYAAAWLLLVKASHDAGAEVQSGALGWISLARSIRPKFPDMPVLGTFAVIRQPIYAAFALTLWTVPVWTPDQLVVALTLTLYCVTAPILKEKRFMTRFGGRFAAYRARVPYMVPRVPPFQTRQDKRTDG